MKKIITNIVKNKFKILIRTLIIFFLLMIFWDTIEFFTLKLTDSEFLINLVWYIYFTIYYINLSAMVLALLLIILKIKNN